MKGISLLVAGGLALSGCPPTPSPPASGPVGRPPAIPARTTSTTDVSVTAPPVELAPLPPGAEAVARAYASTVASYRFDAGPGALVSELAPLCTPAWLAALRRGVAPAPSGQWDEVVANREVAVARVLSVHPARSVGPTRRAVVAVRVEVAGATGGHVRAAVITVDLVEADGGWLVGFAS